VEKGSVCVDGVSLTVVSCGPLQGKAGEDEFWFKVALIPHTWDVTTMGSLKVGSEVNVETDIIARYVARLTNIQTVREAVDGERPTINR
jgi:riboflavin synthase alpha subunit